MLVAAVQNPDEFLNWHQSGDWGDVPPEHARGNEFAVHEGFCILSSYPVGSSAGHVWLISETDSPRSFIENSSRFATVTPGTSSREPPVVEVFVAKPMKELRNGPWAGHAEPGVHGNKRGADRRRRAAGATDTKG